MLQITSILDLDNYDHELSPDEAEVFIVAVTIATLQARGDYDEAALCQYSRAGGLRSPDGITANDLPEVAERIANNFTLWKAAPARSLQ
jgi:hypothetical protein